MSLAQVEGATLHFKAFGILGYSNKHNKQIIAMENRINIENNIQQCSGNHCVNSGGIEKEFTNYGKDHLERILRIIKPQPWSV